MSIFSDELKLDNIEDSLASRFKETATRNIDERSEALYKFIIELCEKASKNGAFELKLKPSDDTIALFRHRTIRNNVFKKLKEEKFKIKIDKSYILIRWES